jgi:predicted nuclease of predicted toxin-antitoxin system
VKLLVDEQLPPARAAWLREQGCEACRKKRAETTAVQALREAQGHAAGAPAFGLR